ncbi:MAG TPA: hypothetical protein VFD91_07835 [Mariniphaga sp.]|nr:hypothetical protein [Mariniphaga sp.]
MLTGILILKLLIEYLSSSDGWGDKPPTMAEALAAPRIRTSSIMSRF